MVRWLWKNIEGTLGHLQVHDGLAVVMQGGSDVIDDVGGLVDGVC